MLNWLPRSILGGVLAAIYVVFAVLVIASDRQSKGGGWITLNGMASFLVTFPVSAPLEMLGHKLQFRRNIEMTAVVASCAFLVYFVGAGIGRAMLLLLVVLRSGS